MASRKNVANCNPPNFLPYNYHGKHFVLPVLLHRSVIGLLGRPAGFRQFFCVVGTAVSGGGA